MSVYVSGFELVWLAWGASGFLSVCFTAYAANRICWHQIRAILTDEDGAAYTLSYVMVIPFYIIMVCAFVETSLMLIAKTGTIYAAFAGARSSMVWNTVGDSESAGRKTRDAVVQAMVPFASGLTEFRRNGSRTPAQTSPRAVAFVDAYQRHVSQENGGTAPYARYVHAKYAYAERATDVTVAIQHRQGKPPWQEDIEVTVEYKFPFSVPIIGRLLGTEQDGEFIFPIRTTVVLQNEAPQNDEKRLGISYASSS